MRYPTPPTIANFSKDLSSSINDRFEKSLPKPLIGSNFDILGLIDSPDSIKPTCMILDKIAATTMAIRRGHNVKINKKTISRAKAIKSGTFKSFKIGRENANPMIVLI